MNHQLALSAPFDPDDPSTETKGSDAGSTASCRDLDEDDDDDDDEDGGAVVVVDEEEEEGGGTRGPPAYFGAVNVVNSNDVHFGNRTVYKGPVTIKQIVYPKGEASRRLGLGGLDNLGHTCGLDGEAKDDGTTARSEKVADGPGGDVSRLRKGFQWMQLHAKRKWTVGIILLSAVLTLVAVITVPTVLRNTETDSSTSKPPSNDEEDNNTPIDYDNDSNATLAQKVRIVPRLGWLAQPPVGPINDLRLPVSLVIVQHTATESCHSQGKCIYQTRHIQTFHIESNGWNDIGYSFLVGGDGDVYEGRGWSKEGAHTFGYNTRSIGVAFIGTFMHEVPPANQVHAFWKLMEKGLELGHLTDDYKIVAARQLQATESPGKAFYEQVIKKWPHWAEKL